VISFANFAQQDQQVRWCLPIKYLRDWCFCHVFWQVCIIIIIVIIMAIVIAVIILYIYLISYIYIIYHCSYHFCVMVYYYYSYNHHSIILVIIILTTISYQYSFSYHFLQMQKLCVSEPDLAIDLGPTRRVMTKIRRAWPSHAWAQGY
jgi:hypothetical protein